MPDSNLKMQLSRNVADLKAVRIGGISKPLEQLTIAELVQMRPGGGVDVEASYSVNAFTDNVSVSTSSLLEQVGQIAKERVMRTEVEDRQLDLLRKRLSHKGVDQ